MVSLLSSFAGLQLGGCSAASQLRARQPARQSPSAAPFAVVAAAPTPRERRIRRHYILRKKLSGSEERPRLAVFRSNQHIYAQVIDDTKNVTLVGLGSVCEAVRKELDNDKESATKSKKAAELVGRMIAEKCKEKGIEAVVFDRGGFKYHGRIQALADAARGAGLLF